MTPAEVLEMFAEVSNIDPRVPAAPTREIATAWARLLDDVPLAVAQDAVRDYYRSARYAKTHDRISTGDIVQFWESICDEARAENRRRMELVAIQEGLDGRAAIEAAKHKPIRRFADQFAVEQARKRARRDGLDPDEVAREVSRSRQAWREVPCSYCGAAVRQPCTVPGTQRELRKSPAHPVRMQAAAALRESA
ncbi:zinc finger domain-containing protein [Saccharopolyspora pogona]|uniref:zinc finger domain-containing protein n=1 Tax=Saccharopolyspora pogona TaxID=333966 RepID=UPI001683DB10|nr:hypothetical protein [Saccharopolyspora pogona]